MRLPGEGFEFRTISGSMTLKKRAEVSMSKLRVNDAEKSRRGCLSKLLRNHRNVLHTCEHSTGS